MEISLLVLEELEAVGVLNMDDDVEFRVPLGLSVLPPTGGGRGSLRLLQQNPMINHDNMKEEFNYCSIVMLFYVKQRHLPEPGVSKG